MTNKMVQAASFPLLQKAQGRGALCPGTGRESGKGGPVHPSGDYLFVYTVPMEERAKMPQTTLGNDLKKWPDGAKAELRSDLNKLATVPLDSLRSVVDKIAKNYPACNAAELAIVEAEQHGISNEQDFADVISAWTYIWSNSEDDAPQVVVDDLASLNLISPDASRVLADLLKEGAPFREMAKVKASQLRIGNALFVSLRGVVDIRCRFHKTNEAFTSGKLPTEVVDVQQVVMASLTLLKPGDSESVIAFLIDEEDLRSMKRFVKNMERELELAKALITRKE